MRAGFWLAAGWIALLGVTWLVRGAGSGGWVHADGAGGGGFGGRVSGSGWLVMVPQR